MNNIELYNDHEIWKSIPGYENYQASNYGRIKSKERTIKQYGHKKMYTRIMREHILRPRMQNSGYQIVWLSHEGHCIAKTVHRLVAITFLGNNEDMDVNHRDGNKKNNSIQNLEWVTRSENIKHSYRVLKHAHNSCCVQCLETGTVYNSIKEAGMLTGINPASISHVVAGRNKTAGGKTWKRI